MPSWLGMEGRLKRLTGDKFTGLWEVELKKKKKCWSVESAGSAAEAVVFPAAIRSC